MKRFALFFALLFLLSGNGFAAEQTIKATEEMVGSGHATKSDTLNRALLVSHSSDGTHKAGLGDLLNGAANLKTFMNAGATAPEWATGVKIITFTRNIAAADGDVAYTGVGFKPSCVIFMAIVNGTTKHSIGYDALSNGLGVLIAYGAASSWINDAAKSITLHDGSAANQYGYIKTFDADGFTITYGHDGSPTGIATIYALCFR